MLNVPPPPRNDLKRGPGRLKRKNRDRADAPPRSETRPPRADTSREICFKWNDGSCPDGTCPMGRRHVCSGCSGPHK
eukprot:1667990-Alexandrium_andersonii.AAC.1